MMLGMYKQLDKTFEQPLIDSGLTTGVKTLLFSYTLGVAGSLAKETYNYLTSDTPTPPHPNPSSTQTSDSPRKMRVMRGWNF